MLTLLIFLTWTCKTFNGLLVNISLASQRNLSSQKKWQAFKVKEKKHEFGLHVRCCSYPSSLTIHEEHLI